MTSSARAITTCDIAPGRYLRKFGPIHSSHTIFHHRAYIRIYYIYIRRKKPNISHLAYISLYYYVITVLLFTHYYSKQRNKQKTTVLHALFTCVITLLILFSKKSLLGIFPRIPKKKILTDFLHRAYLGVLITFHTQYNI